MQSNSLRVNEAGKDLAQRTKISEVQSLNNIGNLRELSSILVRPGEALRDRTS